MNALNLVRIYCLMIPNIVTAFICYILSWPFKNACYFFCYFIVHRFYYLIVNRMTLCVFIYSFCCPLLFIFIIHVKNAFSELCHKYCLFYYSDLCPLRNLEKNWCTCFTWKSIYPLKQELLRKVEQDLLRNCRYFQSLVNKIESVKYQFWYYSFQ